jgi:hypothetical protein
MLLSTFVDYKVFACPSADAKSRMPPARPWRLGLQSRSWTEAHGGADMNVARLTSLRC